jgi:uncharacterized BrkB/YihY/UPF0761 family membrane protein
MMAGQPQDIDELAESTDTPRRGLLWLHGEAHYLLRVVISSASRFYWDNGFSKAAALAYTSLLSLIPTLALAFGIFASFTVSAQYERGAMELVLRQFFPSLWQGDGALNQELLNYLSEFSHSVSSVSALAAPFRRADFHPADQFGGIRVE